MRKTHNSSLPDTCDVLRLVPVKTVSGGTTNTRTVVYNNLPVNAQPRILREIKEDEDGGIVRSGVRWVCTFPFGTKIELDDVLEITSSATAETYQLQVTSHLSPQSNMTAYGVQAILVL